MTTPQESYDQLMARCKDLAVLRAANGIVYWDMETMMPPAGLELRSEQLALMDRVAHQMQVDPEFPRLLKRTEGRGSKGLTPEQQRNVRLARKAYDEESKLPEELVAAMSKHQAISVGAWKRAKAARDYSAFMPELQKMIELKERAATILMRVKGTRTPYDALLDLYEPGMTAEAIDKVFAQMRRGLLKIMKSIEDAPRPNTAFLSRKVGIPAQRRVSAEAMRFVGYQTAGPEAWGRIDETEHPFTGGYYDDVRITTHYYPDRFVSNLFSVLHESGHALYERGLPREWMYQPIGTACSYGIHESQSRFVENMIGRSPEFIEHITPFLKRQAPKALAGVGAETLFKAVNAVGPSKVRVEADEVTYGLHIIIRFELERDIFEHKVTVEELPEAWNEKYARYLGVRVRNDSEGVMQDTHWAGGSFGYFPSYALGNIYGGMFLKKMTKDVPGWRRSVGDGDLGPVRQWLAENIHSKGNLYDPAELVRTVTGERVRVQPFLDYLSAKVERVYGT
ncbi:carboxypeptidase M32 [Methanomassiliicoccus luminyensis]|uniref:carboxypeptidase M32 n=1 Tax=Methanomassiliicoccus luminyensis TaxID=1080712 RepID=UPI0004751976|nr:carboxypeptidase M32 [Methanomassiliicoccus luminyensis]